MSTQREIFENCFFAYMSALEAHMKVFAVDFEKSTEEYKTYCEKRTAFFALFVQIEDSEKRKNFAVGIFADE